MTVRPEAGAQVRCALWLRVSTDEQNAGNQLKPLRSFAERAGYEVAQVYRLQGVSAYGDSQEARRRLETALRDGRAGKFSVLVVWALDRLTRQGVEATFALIRRFRECGVQVVSVQEAWCGTGASGDLMMAIAAWMAEQESARRSERIRAGLERRVAAGLPVGRQLGARDKRPRKRSGYFARWEQVHAEQGRERAGVAAG